MQRTTKLQMDRPSPVNSKEVIEFSFVIAASARTVYLFDCCQRSESNLIWGKSYNRSIPEV